MFSLFDKDVKRKAKLLFVFSLAVILLFGYNATLLGINYNGVMWDWRGFITGESVGLDTASVWGRERFLISYGMTGYENLYHLAVFLHLAYAALLFKAFKGSLLKWKELSVKSTLTKDEYAASGWSLFIIVMYILNAVLFVHEMNVTFLTDVTEFAAPYKYNALLHYDSIFYYGGRGWLFVLLTAAYPVIYYLNKGVNTKANTIEESKLQVQN